MNMRNQARTLLASMTLAAALSLPALGLPEGGQVVNGQVNIGSPLNGQMTIQQLTDHAIINWNAFGINASEMLRFVQPSQLSAILNRVTGQDPSVIMGSLQANGRVFIINPNGVLFGAGSQVNVGSLFASTLNITDENFLHDRFKFDQVDGKAAASIVNQGTLTVSPGGFLVLTSPLIANQGVIVANVGQVALAAGSHTEINFDGQGLINIQVDPAAAQAGPVAVSSGMLNNMVGGLLSLSPADSVSQLPDGVQLAGASGRLVNTGEIHADALPGQAAGHIVLNSQQATLVRGGSLISANGLDKADGGSIRLLSQGLAALDQGAVVQAQGGRLGGNGGFVELSGQGGIRIQGDVDVSAVQGTAGVFLLDPNALRIVSGNGSLDGSIGTTTFGLDDGINTVGTNFINNFNSGTLTLQANVSIDQDPGANINNTHAANLTFTTNTGDISFAANVVTAGTILVTAGRNVALNDGTGNYFISSPSVTLTAGGTGSVASNSGSGQLHVVAGNTVNLTGPGGIFGPNFNINNPSPTQAFLTQTPSLTASAAGPTANIFIANTGAATVDASAGFAALILNNGNLTAGTATGIRGTNFGTGVGVTGNVLASAGTIGLSTSLTEIKASGNIGSSGSPVKVAGSTINLLSSGTGGTTVSNSAATGSVYNLNVTNGPTTITAVGDVGIGAPSFQDPLNGNANTAFSTDAANTLSLTSTNGAIANSGTAPTLAGSTVTLTGRNGVGSAASPINVTSGTISATSSNGNIGLIGAQGSTYSVSATAGSVSVTSPHPITVGAGITGSTATTVTGTGANGDIIAGTGTIGGGGTTTISGHALGVSGTPLQTAGSSLVLNAAASAFVQQNGSANVSGTAGGQMSLNVTGAGVATVNGDLHGGTGSTSLTASTSIVDGGGRVGIAGQTTTLNAPTIGSTANPVKTAGSTVNLQGNSVNASNTGASTFQVTNGTPVAGVSIQSDSTITLVAGSFNTNNSSTVSLISTGGGLAFSPATPFPIVGNSVTLSTVTDLGSAGAGTILTQASTLNASSTGGSVFVSNSGAVTAGGTALNDYNLTNNAQITLSSLTAGGTLNLTSNGNLLGNGGATNLSAVTTNLTATNGQIGTDPNNRLNTQTANLNANGPNGVFIQNNSATTANVSASNGNIDLNVNGDLTLKQIIASGSVKLQTCPTGSILNGNVGPGPVNVQAGTDVTMIAHATIGTDTNAIKVAVPNGALHAAAGDKVNGVSINLTGTTQNNGIDVFDPPAGTACFTGLPPGQGLFNGTVVFQPKVAAVSNNSGGQVQQQQIFVPDQTRQALEAVLVNPFIFNEPAFLDAKQRLTSSSFIPFYTVGLAFLLDKDDWLRFLQETVVWDIDEEEAKDI